MVTAHPALRLRTGVGPFIFSWLPLAQLYIWIAGPQGDDAGNVRLVIWGFQWAIGLILAGAAAKAVVKRVGWRRLPKALWSMLRSGRTPDVEENAANV